MKTLIFTLLSFTVMGIGTYASAPVPCVGQLRDTEITISSWIGTQMNGSIPLGNSTAVVNLIADSATCLALKAKTPGKLRIRYDTSSLQVVAATDGPVILDPMPICPPSPSPSPSQTPAQVTLTVTAAPAGKASVSWQLTAAPGTQDWIGMYLVSEPNGSTKFVSGKWVYATTATGIFTTDVPANGSYEWRYLLANGYQNVARSAAFIVGPGPTPTPSASPTATPTPTVTPTPSPTPMPTATPSPTPTATPTPVPTPSPLPTVAPTPVPTPAASPSPTGPRVVIRILSTVTATREKQINDIERIEKLKFVGCYSNICYFERP